MASCKTLHNDLLNSKRKICKQRKNLIYKNYLYCLQEFEREFETAGICQNILSASEEGEDSEEERRRKEEVDSANREERRGKGEEDRDGEKGEDNDLSKEFKVESILSEKEETEKETLYPVKAPKSEDNTGQSDVKLPEKESAVIVEGVVGEKETKGPVLSEGYLSPSFTVSATSGPFGL